MFFALCDCEHIAIALLYGKALTANREVPRLGVQVVCAVSFMFIFGASQTVMNNSFPIYGINIHLDEPTGP